MNSFILFCRKGSGSTPMSSLSSFSLPQLRSYSSSCRKPRTEHLMILPHPLRSEEPIKNVPLLRMVKRCSQWGRRLNDNFILGINNLICFLWNVLRNLLNTVKLVLGKYHYIILSFRAYNRVFPGIASIKACSLTIYLFMLNRTFHFFSVIIYYSQLF